MAGDVNTVPLGGGCLRIEDQALRDDVHVLVDRLPADILSGIRRVLAKYAALRGRRAGGRCAVGVERTTVRYPLSPHRRAEPPG